MSSRFGSTSKKNKHGNTWGIGGTYSASMFKDKNLNFDERLDTESELIRELELDCEFGNYENDLINKLRKIYVGFDVTKKDEEMLLKLKLKAKGRTFSGYLSLYSLYSMGLRVNNYVFEFGKYPSKEDETQQKEKEQTEDRMAKKYKNFAKEMKKKKDKKTIEKSNTKFLDSHLLGFGEGYGNGLAQPTSVTYGYESLIKSIETIEEGAHVPVHGVLNPVVKKWCKPLTVITVMACEGGRFNPCSRFFSSLMSSKQTKSLRPELNYMFQKWNKMTKVLTGQTRDVPGRKLHGHGVAYFWKWTRLNEDIVRALKKNKKWLKNVVALKCRSDLING